MPTYIITLNSTAKLGYTDIDALFDLIPVHFESMDYMRGFLQGLCFGYQIVYSTVEFQNKINNGQSFRMPVKFVTVGAE